MMIQVTGIAGKPLNRKLASFERPPPNPTAGVFASLMLFTLKILFATLG